MSTYTASHMSELVTPNQLVAIRWAANDARINQDEECRRLFRCEKEQLRADSARRFISHLKSLNRDGSLKGKARITAGMRDSLCFYFKFPFGNLDIEASLCNLPRSHRRWSDDAQAWVIRNRHLQFVCDLARRFEKALLVEAGREIDLKTDCSQRGSAESADGESAGCEQR